MKLFFLLALLFLTLFNTANAQKSQWRPLSGSRQSNISGMALIEHSISKTAFLIVHDNKKKEQTHAAIITFEGNDAPTYTPVRWLGDDVPVDLEAVTTIPNVVNEFMAFTAAGRVFHIRLDKSTKTISVLKSFDVPSVPKDADFEGFVMQIVDDQLLAVWADRGLDERPATLFWAIFDLQINSFKQVGFATFKVPYPIGNTRHISDVKVDETGAVYVSSASDPGNDGPFSSAIYLAGVLKTQPNSSIKFFQTPILTRLFHFDYHKVEAIELVSGTNGGFVFGSDDENLGSAVYLDW